MAAEYVNSPDLKIGHVYFVVHFLDDEMLVPALRPVVFIGRNFESSDSDDVYFQDFGSYQEGIRYGDEQPWNDVAGVEQAQPMSEANFDVIQAGSPFVMTYENALNVLLAVKARS